MVIKSSYRMRKEFANNNDLKDSILIYSMWEGYLPKEEEFWNKNNVPILKIHSSGHAYLGDLKKLVKALNPKHIIPNHTFYPEKFKEHFGNKVLLLNDKEIYTVNNPSAR